MTDYQSIHCLLPAIHLPAQTDCPVPTWSALSPFSCDYCCGAAAAISAPAATVSVGVDEGGGCYNFFIFSYILHHTASLCLPLPFHMPILSFSSCLPSFFLTINHDYSSCCSSCTLLCNICLPHYLLMVSRLILHVPLLYILDQYCTYSLVSL